MLTQWASATRACSVSGPNTAQAASRAQLQGFQRSDFADKVENIVGSISTHRRRRSCFRSMRKARSRHSTARSRAALKKPGDMTMITSATAPRRSLRSRYRDWRGHRRMPARHRAKEFLDFLKKIDRRLPPISICIDRRQLRHPQDPAVQRWLARHKRFTLHFTRPPVPGSTSSSGVREITRQSIRRGIFNNVEELKTTIETGRAPKSKSETLQMDRRRQVDIAKHRAKNVALVKAGRE